MCRLLGISYSDGPREVLTTSEIAAVLFGRLVKGGPHAYGWMGYNEEAHEIRYAKAPGRCDTDEAQDWILDEVDDDARWWVGHTRYATNGSPQDNRNNHPIWHGDIVGVHNGVLSGWESILEETGREDKKSKVDSEAIFAAVNKWGSIGGLKKIEGSMVTLYADINQPDVLHLGRTSGRSITLGWTKNGNLIWASEEQALWELEMWGIEFSHFSKVSENRLLLISNGDILHRVRFRPVPVKRYEPVPVSRFQWDEDDFRKIDWDAFEKSMREEEAATPAPRDNDDDWYIDQQLLKAQRRGRKMFRKDHPRRNEDGSRKYVFYQGNYVTVEEYAEIMTGADKS